MLTIILDFHGYGDVMKPAEPLFYGERGAGRLHFLTCSFTENARTVSEVCLILRDNNDVECRLLTIIPLSPQGAILVPDSTVANRLWQIRTGIVDPLINDFGYVVNHAISVITDFVTNRDSRTGEPCNSDPTRRMWELDRCGITEERTSLPYLFTREEIETIGTFWNDIPVFDDNDRIDRPLDELGHGDDHIVLTGKLYDVILGFKSLIQEKRSSIQQSTGESTVGVGNQYLDEEKLSRIESGFLNNLSDKRKNEPLTAWQGYLPADDLRNLIAREYGILQHERSIHLVHTSIRLKPVIEYCRDSFRLAMLIAFLISKSDDEVQSLLSVDRHWYTVKVCEQKERLATVLSGWIALLNSNYKLLLGKSEELELGRYERCDVSDCTIAASFNPEVVKLFKEVSPDSIPKASRFHLTSKDLTDEFIIWLKSWNPRGKKLIDESNRILDDAKKKVLVKNRKGALTPPVLFKYELNTVEKEYEKASQDVSRLTRIFEPPAWDSRDTVAAVRELEFVSLRRFSSSAGSLLTLIVALVIAGEPWACGMFTLMPHLISAKIITFLISFAAILTAHSFYIYKSRKNVDDAAVNVSNELQKWLDKLLRSFDEGKKFIETICGLEIAVINQANLEACREENIRQRAMVDAHKLLVDSHLDRAKKIVEWFRLPLRDDKTVIEGRIDKVIDHKLSLLENLSIYVPTPYVIEVTPLEVRVNESIRTINSEVLGGMATFEFQSIIPENFGAAEPRRGGQ